MTAPDFLIVDKHVARNPVARAVQKRKVAAATRDFLARVYMLQPGEQVQADIMAASRVLAVAIAILEGRGIDDPVMRGAMSACVACSQRGVRWRQIDAAALDVGLQHANDVYQQAGAQETQDAFWRVDAIERAAQQRDAERDRLAADPRFGQWAARA
jgi:hypothetical protein